MTARFRARGSPAPLNTGNTHPTRGGTVRSGRSYVGCCRGARYCPNATVIPSAARDPPTPSLSTVQCFVGELRATRADVVVLQICAVNDPLTSDLQSLRIDRDPPRSATSVGRSSGIARWFMWPALLGAPMVAGGVWAWPRVEARIFKTEVQSGEIVAVSPVQAATSVTATGYVVALRIATIAPRIPGRVAHVYVREGDHVTENQLLYDLDGSDVRAAVALARARVTSAQSRVAVAHAQLLESQEQLRAPTRAARPRSHTALAESRTSKPG